MGTLENTWGKWEEEMNLKKKRKILSENIFKDKPLSLLCSLLWKYLLIFISEIIYCDNIYSLPKAGKLFKSYIN